MASSLSEKTAAPFKPASIIPGLLDDDRVKSSPPLVGSVSFGGRDPLVYALYRDSTPASKTVSSLPGAYGSVAAAQDVCASDLACLGVRAHDSGPIALLYPGCSRPKTITDLVSAAGTTTWVARR